MTFREYALNYLTARGLSADEASQVLATTLAAPENEAMLGRWNDDAEHYPDIMRNIVRYTLNKHALAFINESCPQAWFKALFTNEESEVEGERA